MTGDSDSRARLCPEHRSDRISSKACVACAQARRIDELETVVEDLVEHVERLSERTEALESDAQDDVEETAQEAASVPANSA